MEFKSLLFELMELRYVVVSTIFCTQFKKKNWHTRLSSAAHVDAVMDNSTRIEA